MLHILILLGSPTAWSVAASFAYASDRVNASLSFGAESACTAAGTHGAGSIAVMLGGALQLERHRVPGTHMGCWGIGYPVHTITPRAAAADPALDGTKMYS